MTTRAPLQHRSARCWWSGLTPRPAKLLATCPVYPVFGGAPDCIRTTVRSLTNSGPRSMRSPATRVASRSAKPASTAFAIARPSSNRSTRCAHTWRWRANSTSP
ncbi:UNVERIFIED_CONTAM: hypothetical protein GTU68_017241 [Idotea baltica]|nr:hypothetical protein [Idotea baltica]